MGPLIKKRMRENILLEGPGNFLSEKSFRFDFKTSNNQTEYESQDMGASKSCCSNNYQLIVGYLFEGFLVKDSLLFKC